MRVLVATVTAGAGHLQAAAALEEAWLSLRPKDEVERLDALEYTSKLYRKAYLDTYIKLVEHAPELWGRLFSKTDDPSLIRKLGRFRRVLAFAKTPGLIRHLKRWKPDVVLCTHYLPLEIVGAVKGSTASPHRPLTVSIVTDFEAHALWMEPSVDLYCVAAEHTKARLVARGANSDMVEITGIPIAAKFSRVAAPRALRKQFGLRDDLPVLLVLGGGFGLGPVVEIVRALNKLEQIVQILVVCGRNEEIRHDLADLDHRQPTRVFGFVTNMHELMAASDLILTKPGGLTSSEALALGKPLVILNPIPGQEAANSDFLLEHAAAVKVNRPEDLPFRLERLLESRKLAAMSRAAKSLGKPHAALEVCRATLRRLSLES